MPLPGKLTIGFLEEDNPVKAYFRIRPMYALDGEGHQEMEGISEKYPEDGCIRIVPDKNELAGFKNRMRTLGRYCALDLRRFPGENEKIRPNKNYGVSSERNACIVYSDVITQIPPETAAQVLDAQYVFVGDEVTLRADAPGTRYVLLKREGQMLGPWIWSEAQDVAGCIALRHAPEKAFLSKPEEEVSPYCVIMEAGEASVVLMTQPQLFGISADEPEPIPAPPVSAPPAPPVLAPPAPAQEPDEPIAAPAQEPIPEPAQPPAPPPAPEPQPRIEPQPQSKPAAQPWIQKSDLGTRLKAVAGRLSLRDQALQAQSGINPRRGRSLSEVVDEQWRRSRYEQLGHPVPPEATGRPVLSPIDRAAEAVKAAWALEDARGGLLGALLGQEDLRGALCEALNIHAQSAAPAADRRMEEMEAERLKLIGEIDALRLRRADMKSQLMEELRQAHRRDFEALEQRSSAMRAELERNEQSARGAEKAAQAARQLLDQSSEQLLQKMMAEAAASRALQRALDGERAVCAGHPPLCEPTSGELISDLRVRLSGAGFELDNGQAVNLLLCAMTGGLAVISGPAGSGKTQLVRQLAQALGLGGETGRFVQAAGVGESAVRDLIEGLDGLTPGILLLDDANLPDAPGAIEGAIRLNERARAEGLALMTILTVQDAPEGLPLSARLLGRAFFLRLEAPAPDAAWKPEHSTPAAPERAVALETLRQILAPAQEMPGAPEERLARLRKALDEAGYRLDRRTLNETWTFCAAMVRAGRVEEMEALDLALSERVLPAMLAGMTLEQLEKLPDLLCDMPRCMALMEKTLPLPPL